MKWTNPHTYILIDVLGNDGVTRNWSIISGTPQLNVRNGWKRDDVKPGDQKHKKDKRRPDAVKPARRMAVGTRA